VELVTAAPGRGGERNAPPAVELQQMAQTYGNTSVLSAAAPMAAEAAKIEAGGLDNAARKTYRAESAQTKNQQSSK